MEDIKKFQFKGNYNSIILSIKYHKVMIENLHKERSIYLCNLWKAKLSRLELMKENYDFFVKLFPEVMDITKFEKEIDKAVNEAMSDKNTEIKLNG